MNWLLRNPLAWRLTLACVVVSALALGVVGFISAASTRTEFAAYLGEQTRQYLLGDLQVYLKDHGSLTGFLPNFPIQPPGNTAGSAEPRQIVSLSPWLVLDQDYRAVFSTPRIRQGARVISSAALPVQLTNRTVAYLVPSGLQLPRDTRSEQFLARTARAIGLAMLGATGLAVLMGLLISRTLLKPLQELRRGIDALRLGLAPAAIFYRRKDEFGEVLTAFGDMHQEVVRNQQEVVRNQQARRQLTADIAHDLNTPLSVISVTLEGLLDGTFKVTPERLRRIYGETQHVAKLVDDLRFLSLADAGELHIDRQPVHVAELITAAVTNFQELTSQRGIHLHISLPQDDVVALDQVRITRVLQNLLSNALTYTPSGGSIQVMARLLSEGLEVNVTDTGAGVAAEHLPFVFDRLYRADQARSTQGSGLGLSICKSIVEAHGGTISLTSTPGQGTTATFTLPRLNGCVA